MENYVIISKKNLIHKAYVGDIIYAERLGRKIHIVMDNEEYEYYGRFEELYKSIDGRFCACRKLCLLNMDKIKTIDSTVNQIIFENGRKMFLGRDNLIYTKQRYAAYVKNLG